MQALKGTVCAGLIAGLLISHRLWAGARTYPPAPVWRGLKPIPPPFDAVIFAVTLALLIWIAATKAPVRSMAALLTLAVSYALWDQTRWQPWFYQYLCMLLVLVLLWSSISACSGPPPP